MPTVRLSAINALPPAAFAATVGPVFEHSPWIAEAVTGERPFGSIDALWDDMCAVVQGSPLPQQLALIRAHPDLVGNAVLTAESQGEQAAAGLIDLTREEVGRFRRYNNEYKQRFDFPFVICARLNKKDAILAAFPVRLANTTAEERATALGEIYKIARLRLHDLIEADVL